MWTKVYSFGIDPSSTHTLNSIIPDVLQTLKLIYLSVKKTNANAIMQNSKL